MNGFLLQETVFRVYQSNAKMRMKGKYKITYEEGARSLINEAYSPHQQVKFWELFSDCRRICQNKSKVYCQ